MNFNDGQNKSKVKRHKVFISYHHKNDQKYRDRFEHLFSKYYDIMDSMSVKTGDIDTNLNTNAIRQIIREKHLSDSTVTVVLIGRETWKRKHVDWEIGASLRGTKNSPRSGLLGIFLPSYQNPKYYNPYTIPPRLYYNIKCGFAEIYTWTEDPNAVQKWIHEAFEKRDKVNPNNKLLPFAKNRKGDRWQP